MLDDRTDWIMLIEIFIFIFKFIRRKIWFSFQSKSSREEQELKLEV